MDAAMQGLMVVLAEGSDPPTDDELATIHVLLTYKPVARGEYMEKLGLGEYGPANPLIQALVKRGVVKITGGRSITPDRTRGLALMKQHPVPAKYRGKLENAYMHFKADEKETPAEKAPRPGQEPKPGKEPAWEPWKAMEDVRGQVQEFLGFGEKKCPDGTHKDPETGKCEPVRPRRKKEPLWIPRSQSKARQEYPESREALMGEMEAIIEAGEHERCPDGSHWNEKTGGCKKIPGALKTYVRNAEKQTKAAHAETGGHWARSMAHSKALAAHMLASDEAAKRGFKDLAKAHRTRQASHHVASEVAARKAGAPAHGEW